MLASRIAFFSLGSLFAAVSLSGQPPVAPPPGLGSPGPPGSNIKFDAVAVARGKALFQSTCGFCHGEDGAGSRAPDLVRSPLTSHDEHGDTLGPVIRGGRQDKGMPSFATLKDNQIDDIVTFLHSQAVAARRSRMMGGDYPLAKLLTGDAKAGKVFFEGAGGCTSCHSVSKDLAGIASRYQPVDLQQQMIYPVPKKSTVVAVVTLPDGQRFEGTVKQQDEFNIGLVGSDGWFRSWPKDRVQVEIKDPLAVHRDLVTKYTDADMHNLFAYLETLQ